MPFYFLSFWCSALSLLLCLPLSALLELAYEAPLHEAYVSKDYEPPVFCAAPTVPPEDLAEKKPKQELPQAIWISGYWAWAENHKEYIWVSGVWRVPPPGMGWIPGYWKEFKGLGWVWINGFWSSLSLEQLTPVRDMPPDAIVENPGFPESTKYFWNPGYWRFNSVKKEYEWVGGRWDLLDANWVLSPTHYQWRPEGYLLIPAYWDWPLNRRGVPYVGLFVSETDRKKEFVPEARLEDAHIYATLITYYPDYLALCQYIYHYHPEYWSLIAPTWWQWRSWWSLPWHNQWALWWWHTHPAYPRPQGLTLDVEEKIRHATPRLFQMVEEISPPFIVTPKKVVPPSVIFSILNKGKPRDQWLPIIPADQKVSNKIKEEAEKVEGDFTVTKQEEMEVEPSKRGKLYGLREAAPTEKPQKQAAVPMDKAVLPGMPLLTPSGGDQEEAPYEHADSKEGVVDPSTGHTDVRLVPVKELRELKQHPDMQKSSRTEPIPHPDPVLFQRRSPSIRYSAPFGDRSPESKKEPREAQGPTVPVEGTAK